MKIAVARVLSIQLRQSAGVQADSAARRAASDGQIFLPSPRSANNARITCSMLTSRLARLVTIFAWTLSLFCATSGSVVVATDPDACFVVTSAVTLCVGVLTMRLVEG
jgi:hypothetical protein